MSDIDIKNKHYSLTKQGEILTFTPFTSIIMPNAPIFEPLQKELTKIQNVKKLILDFKSINNYDPYLISLILMFKNNFKLNQNDITFINIKDETQKFIKTLLPSDENIEPNPTPNFIITYFSQIGNNVIDFFIDYKNFLSFLGNLILKLFLAPFQINKIRWKDFPYHFLHNGVNALPITLLIVFLIGLISGYQGAMQLSKFGADIYIADLIGVSITRELAPLMTAILVAGRSGSAFAAEIGTMKVSDEIDSLNSMGFDYIRFLIIPRILSVVVAMPFLVIMADVAGIFGGWVAAINTLEITTVAYVNELSKALNFAHLFSGLGKSIVFGFLVSIVGCFKGLQVKGGAESVGRNTTASVVIGVFLIILFDAIFTYIFQILDI